MQRLKILWYKFRAMVVSKWVNLFASQTNFDIENTILLVGSTRSGTTFLMESLNSENEYRIIFEPFNPSYTQEWSAFSARHYVNPNNISEEEKDSVRKILSGKIRNKWVDQYNRKIRSGKRIIKSVRANLMLDYFENEYPELKIIYLYRNPFDLVASRMNLNFDPNDVHLVLEYDAFVAQYYSDVDMAKLNKLFVFPEACHAALWCLENRYLLASLDKRRIHATSYEEVIGKTIKFNEGGIEVLCQERRPSVTSSLHGTYELSEKEKANIGEVLYLFGLKDYQPID